MDFAVSFFKRIFQIVGSQLARGIAGQSAQGQIHGAALLGNDVCHLQLARARFNQLGTAAGIIFDDGVQVF